MPVDLGKIKARRESLGMTMDEAAIAAQLKGGRQAWYQVESGNRPNMTVNTLERIAKALDIPLHKLVDSPANTTDQVEKSVAKSKSRVGKSK